MTQEQQAFEVFIMDKYVTLSYPQAFVRDENGLYCNEKIRKDYELWQASRAALKQELLSEEVRQVIQERCIVTGINDEAISYKIDAKAALQAVVGEL